ncbi:50S ribosomal protein L13 [Candidatus Beckwithbacteria bacterium CG22_combo_CG10-13_8_21_14_all_01_47_9]|uniref:Large ribosomal subunit protein uL13 n=5 Tax=Candidatus Beckwithiibacteriota TaxID=1752726 RepID=A0A2H0E1Z2_9BACT|nr:MAG: 50S ribosomal protein L13 [Candidatus Beckwithbacteria bacterium CG1_02_47_37]PIP52411.1 MAG: 50S ribosomal protein L13 [Candidatus Beckwithbacteria bacterium CG23_combo_of_CG06-09_8_20_14_all_47_9]PIP88454.1 MAG: 50S ribosomal protein L13 [Candidatus Beckwithbacteria bacterium CG22_combo_CG10-13_8_21_14_all_01_47_9]PJA22068.1 MAG: 50S ribosomal protein L13 [Candidatus Beckwithbacteria bacterium CG_4_10_14_0_2_um_filter_47_25]PJC66531.1 MAG: 50S ribosomal protein L13 [Candidatus Beckwit
MIKRNWHYLDAKDQILGRFCTQVARLLIGKQKVDYLPNLDGGDYVVVTNSDLVKVTGKKELNKFYYSHSNYPGGFKQISVHEQRVKDSRRLIVHAVSKMLPKNKLRADRLQRLKVFKGSEQPYAQK